MEGDLTFGKKLSCVIITTFDRYKAPLLIQAGCDYYVKLLSSVNLLPRRQYL